MELKIKNIYGIRDELSLKTKDDKRHIIAFAPNGSGKTSLTKGLNDLLEGDEYSPFNETEAEGYELEATFKGQTYSYSKTNPRMMQSRVAILSKDHLLDNLDELKEYLGNYDSDKLGNLEDEKIIRFGMKVQKELEKEGVGNIFGSLEQMSTIELIEFFTKVFEWLNNSSNEGDINNSNDEKIKVLEKLKKDLIEIISAGNGSKKLGTYTEVINANANPESATEDALVDAKLIMEIKTLKKDKQDDFGFKEDSGYVGISNIPEQRVASILKKFTAPEVEVMIALKDNESLQKLLLEKTKKQTFKKSAKQMKNVLQTVEKEIHELKELKALLCIKKMSGDFLKLKANYNKKSSSIIKNINNKFDAINDFFNKNSFDWKVVIKKIKTLTEEVEVGITFRGMGVDYDSFDEYASEGQKNVLKLIITLIQFYGKDMTIILDDLFSSMDSHHTSEVVEVLTTDAFKKIDFLILTHSFEWIKTVSFNRVISENATFCVLDKYNEDKLIKVNATTQDMQTLMYSNKTKAEDIMTLFTGANALRERIYNDLSTEKIPVNGLNADETLKSKSMTEDDLHFAIKELTDFFDQNIRHYKGNLKVSDVLSNFRKKLRIGEENVSYLYHLPVVKIIEKILEDLNAKHSEEIFGELVINQEIDWQMIDNVDRYISYKIFFGSKVRFFNERFKYYSNNTSDEAIKLWESADHWNDAKYKIVPIVKKNKWNASYKLNYLAHANNVQWTYIIETPIYKILSYFPEVNEKELDEE